MSSYRTANTPEGVVIREIFANGEHAYRVTPVGDWHYCGDHKEPWVCICGDEVPARIRDELCRFDTDNALSAV